MKAVLKTAKDKIGTVCWEALYINGQKILENYSLREDVLLKVFKIRDKDLIKLTIFSHYSTISLDFPNQDDFEELFVLQNFNEILKNGNQIYVDDYEDDMFIISAGYITVDKILEKPDNSYLWHSETELDLNNSTFFTTLEIPGTFCWNLLKDKQQSLKSLHLNKAATLIKKYR